MSDRKYSLYGAGGCPAFSIILRGVAVALLFAVAAFSWYTAYSAWSDFQEIREERNKMLRERMTR